MSEFKLRLTWLFVLVQHHEADVFNILEVWPVILVEMVDDISNKFLLNPHEDETIFHYRGRNMQLFEIFNCKSWMLLVCCMPRRWDKNCLYVLSMLRQIKVLDLSLTSIL